MDVFIDMDNTLNNFTMGYIDKYNEVYGTNHNLRAKHLKGYEISKCIPGLTVEEAVNAREEIFCTPGYWSGLPIHDHAIESMKWICDNFNTYILTAPWGNYYDCAKEKYEWLDKHLPFIPKDHIIFCHNKSLIHEDSILLDDYGKNLNLFRGQTIKFVQPFNGDVLSTYEAKNWKQVLTIFKKIKKNG